jgi:hypothetical protein
MTVTIVETRAQARAITGGVDTHADVHAAAALDPVGGLLGVQEFPATPAGYAKLLGWLGGFGTVCLVGVEGTGSYGAGLPSSRSSAGLSLAASSTNTSEPRRSPGQDQWPSSGTRTLAVEYPTCPPPRRLASREEIGAQHLIRALRTRRPGGESSLSLASSESVPLNFSLL